MPEAIASEAKAGAKEVDPEKYKNIKILLWQYCCSTMKER